MVLLCTLLLALGWGAASARSCNGFVAVDGVIFEYDAACYFTAAESAEHAYIRTDLAGGYRALLSLYAERTFDPFTMTLLVLVLPACVIAWLKPDPPAEEARAVSAI